MEKKHHYEATVTWTGNRGTGTSGYAAYDRDRIVHLAEVDGIANRHIREMLDGVPVMSPAVFEPPDYRSWLIDRVVISSRQTPKESCGIPSNRRNGFVKIIDSPSSEGSDDTGRPGLF